MFKLCQELVWFDSNHRHNTYCMRERGHAGKHNPDGNFEPGEPGKTTALMSASAPPSSSALTSSPVQPTSEI
jgi:hypothetical protein